MSSFYCSNKDDIMKLYLLTILMFCGGIFAQAQYSERFNNLLFPTNSSWSSALPVGITQYNLDGLIPASQITTAFPNNEAWVSHIADEDTFAASHSWYDPAGTSNDWLVTPTIYVPLATATETPFLIWDVKAQDANFPDGYMIKVSTNGNQPANFASSPLFEETAAPATFTKRAISLASFAGQYINIAFINNSDDKFMLYVDDVEVKTLSNAPDVNLFRLKANRIAKVNEAVFLAGTLTNNSGTIINSLDITWSDGFNNYDMTLSGLSILPLQNYDFIHTMPFSSNVIDERDVLMLIPSVNNMPDIQPLNNSQSLKISTVSKDIFKAVVFEEVTGTWCGWCPRGIVSISYMDSLYGNTGQFIPISIHTQDTMAMDDYADSTQIHLIPRTNVDRMLFNQETNIAGYQAYFDVQKSLPPPAAITTTAFFQSQQVSVQVSAEFDTKMTTGLRFAVVLVEDDIHSEHSAFDQVNLYYYYGSQNPMGGFEYLPDPVPASQMWYNHVARALLGGYDGEINSLPATVYEGNVISYNFYYTLPPNVNPFNTKAIGMLIDEETGHIYNAQSVPLIYGAVGVAATKEPILNVFPNPTSKELNICFETEHAQEISIALYNHLGQKVKSKHFSAYIGEQNEILKVEDMAAGSYLMGISMEGKSFWRNIVIVR